MSKKYTLQRPGYQTHVEIENGIAKSHSTQHDRSAILERNAELRKNDGAVRTWDFGKLELDIPITDFKVLAKLYPGLDDPRHPDHKYQMRKFLKSPASAPYRVIEQKRGVNR